jgi:hypothetical protein
VQVSMQPGVILLCLRPVAIRHRIQEREIAGIR